jgi:hypothetical protein
MNIEIKGCKTCPFIKSSTTWMDTEIGFCKLIFYLNNTKKRTLNLIEYNKDKVESKNKKTLDNCPLINKSLTIELK